MKLAFVIFSNHRITWITNFARCTVTFSAGLERTGFLISEKLIYLIYFFLFIFKVFFTFCVSDTLANASHHHDNLYLCRPGCMVTSRRLHQSLRILDYYCFKLNTVHLFSLTSPVCYVFQTNDIDTNDPRGCFLSLNIDLDSWRLHARKPVNQNLL